MDKSDETVAAQVPQSPHSTTLYCEECLRVDHSFDDILNSAIEDEWRELRLSLRVDPGNIREETTCPSCRDILNLLDKEASKAEYVHLLLSMGSLFTGVRLGTSPETDHQPYRDYVYLFRRSEYPKRLRTEVTSSKLANNLPMGHIRRWLQTCELEHEHCRPDPANKLNISLYLIDVVEECITIMPVSDVPYVALSYVWGNAKSTKLTSGNMEQLKKPQSLSLGSHAVIVPQTIRDAMHLTKDLELRYLWVDCFCIIQDDPSLGLYLDQMHCIYHNAFVTIVVANKDNADGGLTGYETSSAGRILPGDLIAYPNYVLGIESPRTTKAQLPWDSRGWTLQEGFFSRRALVVSDRVTLICLQDAMEEGMDFGYEGSNFMTKRMIRLRQSICRSSSTSKSWLRYSELVRRFAFRDFSYEADVAKAFLGIISYFTRPDENGTTLTTEILYGHPVHTSMQSLLWRSEGHALRKRNIPLRQDGSPTVPTWSWMAWQHDNLSDSRWGVDLWRHRPERIAFDAPTVSIAECGIYLQTHKINNETCSEEKCLERIMPEYPDPYLYVGAQRGQFNVTQHVFDGRSFMCLSARGDDDRSITGQAFFDNQPPQLSPGRVVTFDFVGIHAEMDFNKVLQVEALCIKPAYDRPGVFERLGVATIRKDAWDLVARFDENIVLG